MERCTIVTLVLIGKSVYDMGKTSVLSYFRLSRTLDFIDFESPRELLVLQHVTLLAQLGLAH